MRPSALLLAEGHQERCRRPGISGDQRHGDDGKQEGEHEEDLVGQMDETARLQAELQGVGPHGETAQARADPVHNRG